MGRTRDALHIGYGWLLVGAKSDDGNEPGFDPTVYGPYQAFADAISPYRLREHLAHLLHEQWRAKHPLPIPEHEPRTLLSDAELELLLE